jgi:hypothetical protein
MSATGTSNVRKQAAPAVQRTAQQRFMDVMQSTPVICLTVLTLIVGLPTACYFVPALVPIFAALGLIASASAVGFLTTRLVMDTIATQRFRAEVFESGVSYGQCAGAAFAALAFVTFAVAEIVLAIGILTN